MGKYHDLTGMKFGRLTVVKLAEPSPQKKHRGKRWECVCDCGNTTVARADSLKSKHKSSGVKSCGCFQEESRRKAITKHGYCGTRLYSEWANMKSRCWYSSHQSYSNYGGRGITICDEWHDFEPFKNWALKNGYTDNLTLDRINNDGNYEPSNCRWITASEQGHNVRPYKKNTTGVLGVRFRKEVGKNGKYYAFIGVNKRQKHIGVYDTLEEAAEARKQAEQQYYPGIRQS